MLTYEEIKKMNRTEITKKVAELKKDYFEKRQKLLRGEFKDISEFKKIKRTVARLMTMATTLPQDIVKIVKEPVVVEAKESKAEKAKTKTAKPKAEKKPAEKKAKVKKEEKSK